MESHPWRVLLMVAMALAASAQQAQKQALSSEAVVSRVVQTFNRLEERTSTFRLLEAAAPPEWGALPKGSPQELKFTIKETVCGVRWEMGPAGKCGFKDGGLKKFCAGTYTAEHNYHFIFARCDDTETELDPKTRGTWKTLKKKLIKKFRKGGEKYNSSIAVTIT